MALDVTQNCSLWRMLMNPGRMEMDERETEKGKWKKWKLKSSSKKGNGK